MSDRRFENLDMLRGGAALAVLLAHATIPSQRAVSPVVSDVRSLLVHLGATAVWLFFVVSGLVISRPFVQRLIAGASLPDLRTFAARRSARIYPLYWLCVPVVVLFGGGWAGARVGDKIAHVLLLHNVVPGRQHAFIPVSWTLTLEILFYVSVALGAAAVHRFTRGRPVPVDGLVATVLALWALAMVALAAVPGSIDDPTRALWLRESFPTMVGMFAPGVLLAAALTATPTSRTAAAWRWLSDRPGLVTAGGVLGCICGAALAAVPVEPGDVGRLVAWDLSRHAYAVGYGLLVGRAALAADWQFRGVGVLRHLGAVSYGVYLIHGVLLLVALDNRWLIPLDRPGLDSYLVHAALLATATIALASATWRWVERPLSDGIRGRTSSAPHEDPPPAAPPVRTVGAP